MKNYKKISIIIPNLNSPIIGQTVDSLLNHTILLPYEIIIVGQDKYGIVEKIIDKRVKFIETENPTPPALSNFEIEGIFSKAWEKMVKAISH